MMQTRTRGRCDNSLTDSEAQTLKVIEKYLRQHNYPPTLQDIASMRGITPPSVYAQLNGLVKKGYITREPRKARGLTLIRQADSASSDLVSIPLVGAVSAGVPILADENIIGEVLIEGTIAGAGPCFALRVRGDSMVRANIDDGDVVIVRQQLLAENGDVVVALVDGESTIKRLSIREQHIELCPENPRYKPIPIGLNADFRILGKVVATRRAR